jgi:putative ABC transport system ATP-binding protein
MRRIDLLQVRKTFGPVVAVDDIDLSIAAGEQVAILGPSGSGKSTLLNVVAGLERPDDGTVTLAGIDLTSLSGSAAARIRRRHIGIVFQFFNLLESMSAADNVALAARIAGRSRRAAAARATELLDVLGLLDKAGARPVTLSGGQRQRLAIARALASEPTLLLADEPTGALDSDGTAEILELFGRLHEGGQAIVVVTHDDEVAARADRIVAMRDGVILVDSDHRARP